MHFNLKAFKFGWPNNYESSPIRKILELRLKEIRNSKLKEFEI